MKASPSKLFAITLLLAACEAPAAEDSAEIRGRYKGRYTGPCAAWSTSPATGSVYCSSPPLAFSTDAAYAASTAKKAEDPAMAGFDGKSPEEKMTILKTMGEGVYQSQCAACHQKDGAGLAPTFPPLVNDPIANGGPVDQHIQVVLQGMSGKAINGVTYSGAMIPFAATLSDTEIAAVITFERNSWGNNGGLVEPSQVAAARGK